MRKRRRKGKGRKGRERKGREDREEELASSEEVFDCIQFLILILVPRAKT